MNRPAIPFLEICKRIEEFKFPAIDMVIGIARGGAVPASLIACHLNKPLEVVRIKYRDEDNKPIYPFPKMFMTIDPLTIRNKSILLVDDVSVTGKTMDAARNLIPAHKIYTCVLKGYADYTLMPDMNTCVKWPWNVYEKTPDQVFE